MQNNLAVLVGFSFVLLFSALVEQTKAINDFKLTKGLLQLKSASFSSYNRMNNIVSISSIFNDHVNKYIKDKYKHNAFSKELFKQFNELTEKAVKDVKKFAGNPINCYLIIKQLTHDTEILLKKMPAPNLSGTWNLEAYIKKEIKDQYGFPSKNDELFDMINTILRLQETYSVETLQLVNGNMSKLYPTRALNANECFIIGSMAYEQNDTYNAFQWLKVGYERLPEKERKSELNTIKQLIDSAIKENEKDYAQKVIQDYLSIKPEDKVVKEKLEILDVNSLPRKSVKKASENEWYDALCRGENVPNHSTNSMLKCSYVNNGHPLLIIGPVKEERVSLNPFIAIYHDVVTEKQANQIKQDAFPSLERSLTAATDGQKVVNSARISETTWLYEQQNKLMNDLSEYVGAITNTNISVAEPWQIVNYGIGGYYAPHHDFLYEASLKDHFAQVGGNRMSTWMIYLGEPEVGGQTIFPHLKVRVNPKFRAAVFWYNIYRNSQLNFNTLHSGCPVLFGAKWIANKWIREKTQEFTTKCGLVNEKDY